MIIGATAAAAVLSIANQLTQGEKVILRSQRQRVSLSEKAERMRILVDNSRARAEERKEKRG